MGINISYVLCADNYRITCEISIYNKMAGVTSFNENWIEFVISPFQTSLGTRPLLLSVGIV